MPCNPLAAKGLAREACQVVGVSVVQLHDLHTLLSGLRRESAGERELTLRGLFEQLLRTLSTIDGRLMRSLRSLLSRPGALTVAYVQGQRIPYSGPVAVVPRSQRAVLAMQSLTSTNVVSSTLDSHLHHQDCSALAQRLVLLGYRFVLFLITLHTT